MIRNRAARALLALISLLIVVGLVAGAVAAGPRDREDGDRRDQGQDVTPAPKVTEDRDGDLTPDVVDNCPDVYNPDQADGDGNGVGDVCQPPPDADADGVEDGLDNCPAVANPRQNDSDGDGSGDACDNVDDSLPPPEETAVPTTPTVGGETGAGTDGGGAAAGDPAVDAAVVAPRPERRRDRPRRTAGRAAPRDSLGPPPSVKPFVVPPETFELIARIDAGALPPVGEGTALSQASDPAAPPAEPAPAAVDADLPVPVVADAVLETDPARAPDAAGPDGVAADRAPAPEPWGLDAYFAGGLARTRPEVGAIAGTDDDALYLTQRRGDARGKPGEFSYAIPVPEAGTYRVRLHFAEIYWGAPGGAPGGDTGPEGQRVFSVEAEGTPKLVDYDIVADVGPATAVVKQFAVPVTDGELDLRFAATRDQPMVAAIEVLGEPIGERWVDVNKKTRTVRLMVGGTAVATYAAQMSVGPEDDFHDTMPGTYAIENKVAELTWTPYADAYFMYWAGFDLPRENGFHSYTMDHRGRVEAEGDAPTWGCVATPPDDAAAIFNFVEVGTRVEIHW